MSAQASKPTLAPNRKLHFEDRPASNPEIFHVAILKVYNPLDGSTPARAERRNTTHKSRNAEKAM
jgi:hypothetical protein